MSDAFPARQLSRRRFLTISASAATLALMPGAGFAAAPVHRWRGAGLGADAAILLAHPDERQAQRIFALCEGEIARLEKIFSLFRDDSALSRLNRDGRLAAPPLEMVSLLSTAARVHEASEGAFDPTVQPLWALYATHYAARPGAAGGPGRAAIDAALRSVGWHHVAVDPAEIRFARPGMALTLNGIAQGYVTDRIADLLAAEGMENVLVDIGEIRALGHAPDGSTWPVTIRPGGRHNLPDTKIGLASRALATTAATGTCFDAAGRVGHVLDPRSGNPVTANLAASAFAASAAIADGLSTAAIALTPAQAGKAVSRFPNAGLRLVGSDRTARVFGVTA
ncbi:MAG TPA: FAD:protein FMN transferase [Hyphomicrobiales bacterium]|nr:FAD:protein FMN transferase [Rhodobiaceae bacterium]HXK53573.1 FAD:protein FMN transferase [Hyphomicrobiales bacterium]